METKLLPTRYFEDTEVGTELPPMVKRPDEVQIFAFSATTWDTHRIHFDAPYSVDEEKLPGILVHGHLLGAFLSQLFTDWAGPRSRLRRFAFQNRGMVVPGDTLTCAGKVTEKREEDGKGVVVCQVWVENQRGEHPTTGDATIELPMRRNQ